MMHIVKALLSLQGGGGLFNFGNSRGQIISKVGLFETEGSFAK